MNCQITRSTRSRSMLVVSSTPTPPPPPSPPHRYDKVRCFLLFNDLLSRSSSFHNQLSKRRFLLLLFFFFFFLEADIHVHVLFTFTSSFLCVLLQARKVCELRRYEREREMLRQRHDRKRTRENDLLVKVTKGRRSRLRHRKTRRRRRRRREERRGDRKVGVLQSKASKENTSCYYF